MRWLRFAFALSFLGLAGLLLAQVSGGPARGTLIVHGGGELGVAAERFVTLAGGHEASVVFIPTAASSVRTDSGVIYDPDALLTSPEGREFEQYLLRTFKLKRITILHTRNRQVADSEVFVTPFRTATGVWLGAGNSGRLTQAYLDTRTQQEIEAVLSRGGVVGGTSAGAIIQGSYTVRGRPDKPLLMAKGHERGFGFLQNVAINPHLLTAKREAELINVVDTYPHLLGIGIDENTALVVQGDEFEVIGESKVAIYDNHKHGNNWFFVLSPGARFNLRTRKAISGAAAAPSP